VVEPAADPAAASTSNAHWFARARRSIPGGVDSPVRSFASVGGDPFTVVRGEGPWVWDADGRRYLDFIQSYGAVLLGHAHPAVVEAIRAAAVLGTTFGMPTPGEVLLAEAICTRVPGCEQVRLVSSGTEAAMSAVRVARGFTGRDRVVKFGESTLRPFMVVPQQLGQSEVVIQMFEAEGRFVGFLNYNVDVLDHATAASMAADYSSLLTAVTLNPKARLDELPIHAGAEGVCLEEFVF